MPTQRNIEVWRGADFLQVWRLLDKDNNPVVLTGYVLRLSVVSSKKELKFRKDLNIQNAMSLLAQSMAVAQFGNVNGCIEVKMTVVETRSLDLGNHSLYEIEQRVSGLQNPPLVYGAITANGGINDD